MSEQDDSKNRRLVDFMQSIPRGSYEPRGSNISQQYWRGFFLEVVDYCEPQVLKELGEEPLRSFLELDWTRFKPDWPCVESAEDSELEDLPDLSWMWIHLVSADWERHPDEHFIRFRRDLWGWAERWKLAEDWCLRAALDSVAEWAVRAPRARRRRSWSLSIHSLAAETTSSSSDIDRGFMFSHHGWDVLWVNREGYEEGVRRKFEAALKAHCDAVEQNALSQGYEPVQGWSAKYKPNLPLEWLVRYRIQGWKIHAINKHYYPRSDNRNTIRNGINEVAALIGFPPYSFAAPG
jgi:hypothetical protein